LTKLKNIYNSNTTLSYATTYAKGRRTSSVSQQGGHPCLQTYLEILYKVISKISLYKIFCLL